MKLALLTASAIIMAPADLANGFSCYNMGDRSFRARASFSPEQPAEYIREQQEQINRAFEELKEDFSKQSERPDGFEAFNTKQQRDFFNVDKDTLQKQRDWVKRAFDIASEFNSDFAATPEEAQRADEVIRKSREWIDRMYGIGNPAAQTESVSKPWYEIRDSEEKFEVSLDVPGVKREDIDITLDEDKRVLKIQAEREVVGNAGEPRTVEISQSFDLDENVDVERIDASLDSGVLVVSAQKKPKEKSSSKKIPVF